MIAALGFQRLDKEVLSGDLQELLVRLRVGPDLVDLRGLREPDPLALPVQTACCEFLARQSVEIELAASRSGQHLGQCDLDEADLVDRESVGRK